MKFTCTQENLNRGLSVVSHVAAKSTTLPILSNVRMEASGGVIKLSATNLEIGVTSTVRGKVESDGTYTVDARLLSDYVGLLPHEQVDVSLDSAGEASSLEVSCANHRTKVRGIQASDFPIIPEVGKEVVARCSTGAFREAVSQVAFAVSMSETRPEIGGVLFSFSGGALTLAATDSYRLAERTIVLQAGPTDDRRLIVPARALQEVQRVLGGSKEGDIDGEGSDTLEMYLADNQIQFSFGSVDISSRLVEGTYPDYRQIVPTQHETAATVDAAELAKAVKSTSLFARSGIYDVSLEVKPDSNELVVSSVNAQVGENVSTLSIEASGKPLKTVINFRYLLDCLGTAPGERVDFQVRDADSPLVIKPSGDEQGYLYLIMPIKQS